jgi:diacylglycerol kinase (ATP)
MQERDPRTSRQKPARAAGLARIVAAAGYSVGGARRLWLEPACRQELIAAAVVLVLFVLKGASPVAYIGFTILALMVLATEALNTALEEVVDHLSPDWSAFAKHAKDLGSLAVMCQMIAAGLFAGYVLLT